MHEAVYMVHSIIKGWLIHGIHVIISRLPSPSSGEAIGSVLSTWNVNKGEVEEEYGEEPAIDTVGWCEVQV